MKREYEDSKSSSPLSSRAFKISFLEDFISSLGRHWYVPVILGLLCLMVAYLLSGARSLRFLEYRTYNWRVALRSHRYFSSIQAPTHFRNPDVVVVPIDDKTLDEIKEPTFFWTPFFAEVFDSLTSNGVKVIALDYQFQISPDEYLNRRIFSVFEDMITSEDLDLDPDLVRGYLPNTEMMMMRSLLSKKVALMTFIRGDGSVSKPYYKFTAVAGRENLGLVNTAPDGDGVARRQFLQAGGHLEDGTWESFPILMLVTAARYLDAEIRFRKEWHLKREEILRWEELMRILGEKKSPPAQKLYDMLDTATLEVIELWKPDREMTVREMDTVVFGLNKLMDSREIAKDPVLNEFSPVDLPGNATDRVIRRHNRRILEKVLPGVIFPAESGSSHGKFHLGEDVIPHDDEYRILINYVGPPGTFMSRYSFSDLLKKAREGDDEFFRKNFQGKAVLIGPGHSGSTDLVVTPYSTFDSLEMYGIEVHANILNTILNRDYIHRASPWLNGLILLICAIGGSLLCYYLRPGVSAGALMLTALIVTGIVFFVFFRYNLWLDLVPPLSVMPISFGVVYSFRYLSEDREKKYIREILGRYISESVAHEILRDPRKLALGGKRCDCTILFCDINDFTTYSEKTEPEKVIATLNDYFTRMEPIIFKYQGTLKQFVGDEIMVISGAPQPDEDHAWRVCKIGLEMVRELERWQQERRRDNRFAFDVKFGIHSGPVVAGNVGSPHRTEYTTVGDVVNTASRIMGLTKVAGAGIIISSQTYQLVRDLVRVRDLGEYPVKGKQKQVRIYELLEVSPEPSSPLPSEDESGDSPREK